MQRSKFGVAATFVAIGTLTSLAAACGSSSKSEGPSETTTPSGPAPITITAGDYAFQGVPKTMTAGLQNITFVNKGAAAHEMVFLKVAPGTTPDALGTAIEKVFDGKPFAPFMEAANGVADTKPGATTVTQLNLTPGDYIALCGDTDVAGSKKDGPPHFRRGMYAKLTVTGEGGTTPPTAEASIVSRDYAFELKGLKAGAQTIAFVNNGPKEWHFAHISVFPKGVTVARATADIKKLLAANGPPPPGVTPPADVADMQIASPGYGNTLNMTLESGRTYVMLCFVSDLKGGPPHAVGHHMYKIFTVS